MPRAAGPLGGRIQLRFAFSKVPWCLRDRDSGIRGPYSRAHSRPRQFRQGSIKAGDATIPVTNCALLLAATLAVSLLLDGFVRPRDRRLLRWPGLVLHGLTMTGLFGLFLAASGSAVVAAILATALMALFTVASNAKHAMLGEPLVFSDLALLAAMVRHPRFYFTALSATQRWLLAIGAAVAALVLIAAFTPDWRLHAVGFAMMTCATLALAAVLPGRICAGLAREPDLEGDVRRFGLIATLLLYWRRWRETRDPAPLAADEAARQPALHAIVVVQCESFSDPTEITEAALPALPGLAAARASAWQFGNLEVSGFGAYTMRSEYGVLFGREEAELGFRRYDPFLTARGETSHALSARLGRAGYRCTFVHPHDLRFYNRDRLMPAIGFARIIGEDGFAPPASGGGRYIDDRTLGRALGDLIDQAPHPTLIYAVTMENHGPWDSDDTSDPAARLDGYLRHLQNSDALLTDLIARLAANRRPALLVFFGDHRPSIPGVTRPGGPRHTPYVMLRFDEAGQIMRGDNRRVDLTPAALHHAILHCVAP